MDRFLRSIVLYFLRETIIYNAIVTLRRFATRVVFDLNAGVLPQMLPRVYGGGDINR